jgi:hypothetical protein
MVIVGFSQNFVPNNGFEVIESCDLTYGDVPKAKP